MVPNIEFRLGFVCLNNPTTDTLKPERVHLRLGHKPLFLISQMAVANLAR